MTRFMFVGGSVGHLIGVLDFKRFGQVEELEDEHAVEAARGGCAILPAEHEAALAFTAEELKERASFGSHANAPAAFKEKMRQARVVAAEFAAVCEKAWEEQMAAKGPQIVGGEVTLG